MTDRPPTATPAVSYRSLYGNRNFTRLWAAMTISGIGDIFFLFSINWLILQETGSAVQVGGNLIATVVANIVFASVAGALADRWKRRLLMIGSDYLRGIVVLLLAAALWLFPFNIWFVYITTFLLTAVSRFFSPAFQATIPNVLAKEELVKGRSLTSGTSQLVQTVGSALSGIMIALLGSWLGIVINGISFLLSGLILMFTRIPQAGQAATAPLTASSLFGNVVEGWQYLRRHALLFSLFLLFGLSDFGAAFTWPVNVVFAEQALGGDADLYATLATASMLGGFIGALFVGRYSSLFNQHVGLSFFTAASGWGLLTIFFGLNNWIPLAYIYKFLIGWSLAMIHIPTASLLDATLPDEYRGRVWATIGIGSDVAGAVAVGLSGIIADVWDVRLSFLIAGTILVFAGLSTLSIRSVRTARVS